MRRASVKNKNGETEWDRRGFLKGTAWVSTGAVWTMTSGSLKGMSIEHSALGGAARSGAGAAGLRFVQISDSHIGFNKDANPDVTATLRAAIPICFSPAAATVPGGATVTWTNRDDVPHNIVNIEKTNLQAECSRLTRAPRNHFEMSSPSFPPLTTFD
jgi:plastocyanin